MPRRSKGPRLWLEPEERDERGVVARRSSWVIRDGARKIRTGCAPENREDAERALGDYLADKYRPPRDRNRRPAEISVTDVLNIYLADVGKKHARPKETAQRVLTLAEFWHPYSLAEVNGARCADYVGSRVGTPWKSSKPEKTGNDPRLVTEVAARRELEDLRSAINHHHKQGLCSEVIRVALPDKPLPREDWLTREQAAKLIWTAWRAKQFFRDEATKRMVGRHIARFILVGLYTGTRHAAICGAALRPTIGRGWVDLERGVFHRKALGRRATKKRQPSARIPDRLLAHMRRWHRRGIASEAVVEWNGKPVQSVRTGFGTAVAAAGLPSNFTPHILRHTAATWLMQAGVDLYEAAGFLGMTVQVLLDTYGHHHPDFQEAVATTRLGQKRDRNTGNKARQTPRLANENR